MRCALHTYVFARSGDAPALRNGGTGAMVEGMSFLDKAKEMLNQHDDKVDQGLDKAAEAAKGRFAGHEDQIDQLSGQAKRATGGGDTTQAPPPQQAPPPEPPPAPAQP